jgi:hypothetical protein
MGIAVFAGMLGVTLFGLLLTPVFFVTIAILSGARHTPEPQVPPPVGAGAAGVQENA